MPPSGYHTGAERSVAYSRRYLDFGTEVQASRMVSGETTDALNLGGGTTVTLKEVELLSGGEPSSVTRTVKLLVVPALATGLGQANTPFVELIVAAGGATGSEKVSALGGKSLSVALLVTRNVVPAWMIASATV